MRLRRAICHDAKGIILLGIGAIALELLSFRTVTDTRASFAMTNTTVAELSTTRTGTDTRASGAMGIQGGKYERKSPPNCGGLFFSIAVRVGLAPARHHATATSVTVRLFLTTPNVVDWTRPLRTSFICPEPKQGQSTNS